MEVIQPLLFGTGSATAAFWIGLTAFAGVLFGKFEVRRIRLGAAGVLFSGLLFAHFGAKVDHHVLHFVREFGLILFVFTIGIVLVIITLLVILNLVNSRAGRAIKAIRDNEIAARSVGIPITKYKLMAFVTSAVFAGVAGVLYALNYSSLVAKKFDYNTSILILVFVVLGGIGNLRGSVIAAAVLTVLPELLRSMNDYRMLIYAIVLIVVMIFNQSPEMIALRKRLTARFRKEDAEGKGAKDKEKKGVA